MATKKRTKKQPKKRASKSGGLTFDLGGTLGLSRSSQGKRHARKVVDLGYRAGLRRVHTH